MNNELDIYYEDLIYQIKLLSGLEVKEDKDILERIELRSKGIPVVDNGITCYELSDFTKDLFEFVRTIKQRAGADFTSLEDISKYSELVIEELDKLKTKEKKARFVVMAVPNTSGFRISAEKCTEFKNQTNSREDNEEVLQMAKIFKKNNLVQVTVPK